MSPWRLPQKSTRLPTLRPLVLESAAMLSLQLRPLVTVILLCTPTEVPWRARRPGTVEMREFTSETGTIRSALHRTLSSVIVLAPLSA